MEVERKHSAGSECIVPVKLIQAVIFFCGGARFVDAEPFLQI